jgi:serine/threonine protein kinase
MGNQVGKDGTVPNLYSPSDVRTREAIAGWHRYGIDVWDVYDLEDELGQGSMGPVYQVRRKERGAHTAATRQKSAIMSDSASELTVSEPPKAATISPKLTPKMIYKKTKKTLSGGVGKMGVVGKMVGVGKMGGATKDVRGDEVDDDAPPKKILSEPPKNPSQPKPILKPSHYRNYTNEIPDVDDESEDEEASTNRWKDLNKGRVEHIAGHRSVVLAEKGTEVDSQNVKPEGSSVRSEDSANHKVIFQRRFACKQVLIPHVKEGHMQEMINEIYVMRTLDHPYILKLYEVYQVKRTYCNTLNEIHAFVFVICSDSLLILLVSLSNRKTLDNYRALYRR